MTGPSLMDSLFQRTLEDLIKGVRLHLVNESTFISTSLDEIRREVRSPDHDTKAAAVQKLTYFRSLHGVDDSFAAFPAVELAASPHFRHKQIAYLAASASFHSATSVVLLLTNQLRKDLNSSNEFGRLVENLESSDLQMVSVVVSVFCELASREPNSYLPLAPEFYRVWVDSRNNWVLIKVLKIFAKLAPLEPRLAKRIVEPICEHMRRTGAKSLIFERIRTIVTSLSDYDSAVRLAVAKVQEFLVDDDPNLKYLGLQLVGEEIESRLIDIGMRVKDVRPELVHVGRDLLIDPALLGNPFLKRVLSAAAWVSGAYVEFSKNPIELMEGLLQPRTGLLPPSIRVVYIQSAFKVLIFCLHSYLFPKEAVASSSRAYDLEPRVADAIYERGCPEGSNLATSEALASSEQNEDFNPRFLCQSVEDNYSENDRETLVAPGPSSSAASLNKLQFTHGSIINLLDLVETALGPLGGSHEVEVQERVRNVLGLIKLVEQEIRITPMQNEGKFVMEKLKASEVMKLMHDAFLGELGPVSMSAQERVPIPDGLMLKENLNDLETVCVLLANAGNSEVGNSSPRRSKHVCHGKERKHRSPRKNVEGSEERSCRDKKKSGHRHGKNKARQRGDGRVNVVTQTGNPRFSTVASRLGIEIP
ncbi:AP-3 complex subunit delta like [Actinidia chinensis var. chinensis]|uniref:AP-3 complex subunit delta like n=1 Tax=Actinidia chinensis var. chinensis TaxID=1590841 RepID=A0A2R6P532_ACTCC|nr:AP-3 complex subunit delta like [Actinidia chinensis var. chinensis]